MKTVLTHILVFLFITAGIAQQEFIQIEVNKNLCLISFLETASNQRGTSSSLREYIFEHLGTDEKFVQIVNAYSSLNLEYNTQRQEYPDKRYSDFNSKDLLWVAASNSNGIEDFAERIIGYLPHSTHISLIDAMGKVEPYYDQLIWNSEQTNSDRIIGQMSNYKTEIAESFLAISTFYNTSWDQSVPFKISLYPIPMAMGNTTAIPKGNILICGFLAHLENDYKGILGVSIHEMCHILFSEQTSDFQHQIDQWFKESDSPYANLAYSYLDEGLATALGNGWAYEQINGTLDEGSWYNNEYIDGFAHAIFPLIKEYMNAKKTMDKDFVDRAIVLFGEKFPNAIYQTNILMNEIVLFANSESENDVNLIAENVRSNFEVRSMWFSTPINEAQSIEKFGKAQTTKVFIVESDNENTLNVLDNNYPTLNINTPMNAMEVLNDSSSQSCIIVINIENLLQLGKALKKLSEMEFLEFGKTHSF